MNHDDNYWTPNGNHRLTALKELGAKAVLVGRPVAWGVAAFGVRGVERVYGILNEEMKRAMCMTGVASVGEINKTILILDD